MDERVTGELPDEDEYAALDDPPRVMAEVLRLLDELRSTNKKLGDALEVAGVPGREWRSEDARLSLLSEQFPDISVDDLITRLAEFAAGHAPPWLRGDAGTIGRFREEVEILYGVLRSLRQMAQRQRMLPARDRGGLPLERALGDARVGTALDLAARDLRDLDSLGPFIAPLTPEEWQALDAAQPSATTAIAAAAAGAATGGAQPPTAYAPPASATPVTAPMAPGSGAVPTSPTSPTPPATPTHTRLRDFAPPRGEGGAAAQSVSIGSARMAVLLRRALRPNKWWVVALAILTLASGTALLSLAARAPAGHLAASPARLTLTCAGKGTTAALTLRATGKGPITWSAQPATGIGLSTARGTLKPGASTTIQVAVRTAKAARGTLTFTSNDGTATVIYVVTCA
jgi:hypothetical protein